MMLNQVHGNLERSLVESRNVSRPTACFIPNIIFHIIISFSFDTLYSVHKCLIDRIRLNCTPNLRGNCLSERPVLSLFLAQLTRNSDKPNIGEPPFKPQNNICQCT